VRWSPSALAATPRIGARARVEFKRPANVEVGGEMRRQICVPRLPAATPATAARADALAALLKTQARRTEYLHAGDRISARIWSADERSDLGEQSTEILE